MQVKFPEDVVQNLSDYENSEKECTFVKAVAQGLMDVKNGNVLYLSEVKSKLGIRMELFI